MTPRCGSNEGWWHADVWMKANTDFSDLTDMNQSLINRLKEFLDTEARSCSMDFGCVIPLYVYRMWGGAITMEDIVAGLKELRSREFMIG